MNENELQNKLAQVACHYQDILIVLAPLMAAMMIEKRYRTLPETFTMAFETAEEIVVLWRERKTNAEQEIIHQARAESGADSS